MHKETSMDMQSKRKMNQVLRGLIGSGYNGTQEDIAEVLDSKGFSVTQSTVSRALKKLGVVKINLPEGTRYELKAEEITRSYGGSIANLVQTINHNESSIVIKTNPGAAMFIAGFIDHHCEKTVIGTVAGDDNIVVIPASTKKIKTSIKSINECLGIK
jgi:transcriptional regulator of arginine metabolism